MSSRKHKRNNVFNEHRVDTIDNNVVISEDINQNSTDLRHEPSSLIGATTSTRLYKGQPIQVLEHNGQIFVPLQEDYHVQNKLNKQVYKDGHYINMMNQRTDNRSYDSHMYEETTSNHLHLQETTSSTPKRSRDQLNKSQENRKKSKNDEAQAIYARTTTNHYNSPTTTTNYYNSPTTKTNYNSSTTKTNYNSSTTKTLSGKNYSIPIDQLRRAVGNNLPCFIIEFDKNIAQRDLPSAIIACDLIQEHFIKNKIIITGFSVAVFLGHRLKLGVDNMEDYSRLILSDTWPTSINGKKVSIIKPKFVPDCFTLVIRYIPKAVSIQFVSDEIKRSISSADNIKQIIYSYNRNTNDFRFTVSDLMEYEGALKLGRISIGNRLHPVTVYQPANKMTFCTNCWLIGHTRATCSVLERKCRICLKVYDQDHTSSCSGKPLCAQCGQDHHSLDPKCEVIQHYRKKLNLEVKQAINDGIINRKPIQVHQQHQSQFFGTAYDTDFPVLPNYNNNNIKSKVNKVWPDIPSQRTTTTNTFSNDIIINKLHSMNDGLKQDMKLMKDMIVKKLDEQIMLITKNVQLHQVSICTINSSFMKLIKNVLYPLIDIIPDVHEQVRKQISTALINLEGPLRIHAEQVRINYNTDYYSSTSKSMILPTNVPDNNNVAASPSPSSNTPTLIEETEKPVRFHPCS
ncbi:unnamed protein product [Rotaria sordida]|uniref:Uncharacterized protein n=2 Tax=Rotaria sordida TaxID=392033 RepID=A0A815CHA3_9BILA|nr:unnamed protein product [Rotaria sordida]CAF3884358.1 unnamed protein product [Rotaria sordida]CAF4111574.1 unnamed protein product [Rotaria sordida]CAF4144742.1 unnamed protein product [Rotaria sordida]